MFFEFFGLLKSSWLFVSSFFDFEWIWGGFGTDFGRVWEDFWKIFWIFLEKADFVKYSVFLGKNQ